MAYTLEPVVELNITAFFSLFIAFECFEAHVFQLVTTANSPCDGRQTAALRRASIACSCFVFSVLSNPLKGNLI